VPKQTGKGSHKRKQAAFERKATQHHDFIGEAAPERAEAELHKRERLEEERNKDAVREMAAELEEVSGVKGDGAVGPEIPVRIPRSIDEGKRLIREAPDAMREKARERLEQLPERTRKALEIAQDLAGLFFAPLRIGFAVGRELLRVPGALLRVLRQKEA
jgi:hypothetical protein